MNAGTIAEPRWAMLLWLVAAFFALAVFLERRRISTVSAFVSAALQERLVRRPSSRRRMLALVFFFLSATSLTIALMRPQWGLRLISTPRAGAEIMICLDVSRSMLAEDVAPNRLERAKADLRDLLPYLEGDQVGLIAFAGRATVLAPLTPDFGFLRLVLDQAGPQSVTRGGTRLEEPIRKAVEGFGDAGEVSRSIILVTDGEDHDSFPLQAAKRAAERGIKILAIGFGDEAGSEIVITDPATGARRLLRDTDGNVVKSRLDGELLRKIALATNGAYVPAGTGVLDLKSIYERHIAPLTRGGGRRHTRTVKGEAFQAFVLLGLLLLIAAVATTAVGVGPRPVRRAGRVAGGRAAALLLVLSVVAAPHAWAAAGNSAGDTDAAAQAATQDQAVQPGSEPASQDGRAETRTAEPGEPPRAIFNRALDAMESGRFDDAEKKFVEARRRAGTDDELRWRATYDLGWNEVKKADAVLASDPKQALERLRRAADWFREAVELRPGSEDARHNLEIVLRRAMQLADSLTAAGEKKLIDRIDDLMDKQRGLLGGLRDALQQQAEAGETADTPALRTTARALAAEQLALSTTANEIAERAATEQNAIAQKPDEQRQPSERVRIAQLAGVQSYLHRARERMGYARSHLRRLQIERAFRRAAAALSELGRARDQLLDPVARLDGIIADSLELARLTGRRAALEAGSEPRSDEAHTGKEGEQRWLTTEFLAERQETVRARTEELHQGFRAGLERSDQATLSPEQSAFVERVARAQPLLEAALDHFADALAELRAGRAAGAADRQFQAIRALAKAREWFLDLQRLIELLYRDQMQADRLLAQTGKTDAERLSEYLPVVGDLERTNRERATRVAGAVGEEMQRLERAAQAPGAGQAPDPQQIAAERMRLETAARLLAPIHDDLERATRALKAAEAAAEPDAQTIAAARKSVHEALEKIEELRRLFFSILDHLKDLARRQLELGDRTEQAAALAKARPDEDHAEAVGPLGARQESLAETAARIADALRRQARRQAEAPAAGDGGQAEQAEQQAALAERLDEAAGHVESAHEGMLGAASNLQINPAPLDDVRADQKLALEELEAAIALFEPPQPQQQQQGDQQKQQRDQDQQQESGAQAEQRPNPANVDPAQLLQGIRDREAQRRAQRAKARQQGYEAVEKDW